MELYSECQKILCVDGSPNISPTDFSIVQVQRPKDLFNWAAAWEAGISAAKHDVLLYLDCDRVLPLDYLSHLYDRINDHTFFYSESLYQIKTNCSLQMVRGIRDNPDEHQRYIRIDNRAPHPPTWKTVQHSRTPMSGNVGFTKTAYKKSGGLDPTYEGWGYPDYDYYLQTYRQGYHFETIKGREFHLKHGYPNDKEFQFMNLWNAVKFCTKWNIKASVGMRETAAGFSLQDPFMLLVYQSYNQAKEAVLAD